jgi:hypothetical protein
MRAQRTHGALKSASSGHKIDGTDVIGVTRVTRSNREAIATFVTKMHSITGRGAAIPAAGERRAQNTRWNAAAKRVMAARSDTLGNR